MAMEAALRARLITDPATSWIVDNRVHWLLRPQGGALPAIVLQLISEIRGQHLKGFQAIVESRVQVNCLAASHVAAVDLAEAAIAAIAPEGDELEVTFMRAMIEAQADDAEETPTGFVFRRRFDARLFWKSNS